MTKNKTKVAPCQCCPEGAVFEATGEDRYDEDGIRAGFVPVWECNNCHRKIPRRVIRPTTRAEPTPSQMRTIERLRRIETMDGVDVVHDETIGIVGRRVFWVAKVGPNGREGCLPLLDRQVIYSIGPNGKAEKKS